MLISGHTQASNRNTTPELECLPEILYYFHFYSNMEITGTRQQGITHFIRVGVFLESEEGISETEIRDIR